MDDEVVQARKVAEAARRLRELEVAKHLLFGAGDFDYREFYDRVRALLADLDTEIANWRAFDK